MLILCLCPTSICRTLLLSNFGGFNPFIETSCSRQQWPSSRTDQFFDFKHTLKKIKRHQNSISDPFFGWISIKYIQISSFSSIWVFHGVSKNRGTPKWMVNIMVPNPMNKWMIWGFSYYFWKHPFKIQCFKSPSHLRL